MHDRKLETQTTEIDNLNFCQICLDKSSRTSLLNRNMECDLASAI